MKKIFIAIVLIAGLAFQKTQAQPRIGMNISIGAQPDWGPYGFDNAQYYYLPDLDMYYDVMNRNYVYFDGYNWQFSPYLPQAYANFDLYNAYKVVINEPRPYLRADYYRRQYYNYRGYRNQPVIRDYRINGGFNSRNERFDKMDQRFDERRDDRFERRDDRNRRGFDQRNDNRGFDQRMNRNDNRGGWNGRNNSWKGRH